MANKTLQTTDLKNHVLKSFEVWYDTISHYKQPQKPMTLKDVKILTQAMKLLATNRVINAFETISYDYEKGNEVTEGIGIDATGGTAKTKYAAGEGAKRIRGRPIAKALAGAKVRLRKAGQVSSKTH